MLVSRNLSATFWLPDPRWCSGASRRRPPTLWSSPGPTLSPSTRGGATATNSWSSWIFDGRCVFRGGPVMLMKIHIYINSDKRKTTDKRMYSALEAGPHFVTKRGETTYVQISQKSQRIGWVIPRHNLQCGITQPILRLFWHICTYISGLFYFGGRLSIK